MKIFLNFYKAKQKNGWLILNHVTFDLGILMNVSCKYFYFYGWVFIRFYDSTRYILLTKLLFTMKKERTKSYRPIVSSPHAAYES